MGVKEGLRRKVRAAARDRFEREEIAFHQRVRQGYLMMADADPEHWWAIDATQSRKKIGELIWERVRQSLLTDALQNDRLKTEGEGMGLQSNSLQTNSLLGGGDAG